MKNITKKASVFAILLFLNFTLVNAQVELAINGGFETGDFTGWEQALINGTQTVGAFNPTEGLNAANLNNDVMQTASLIKNANIGVGVVSPGDVITITFDARGEIGIGGVCFAELFSELTGGGTSASVILGGGPLAINADPEVWTPFSFTTTAGSDVSGGVTLQLNASTGASILSNIFFDNISVSIPGIASIDDASFIAQSLKLFPSPAFDTMTLNNSQSIALQTATIYDLAGRLLRTIDLTNMGTEKTMDVSSLDTAAYLFVIQTEAGQVTKRFVKQ